MTVDVEFCVMDDLLTTRMTGEWPTQDRDIVAHAFEHWSRVTHLCLEHGIKRVLSLSDVRGGSSSSAALRIYADPEDFGWDRSIRLAVVRPDPRARQVIGMAIEVSKRKGWQFELFETEAAGMAWLLAPDAEPRRP